MGRIHLVSIDKVAFELLARLAPNGAPRYVFGTHAVQHSYRFARRATGTVAPHKRTRHGLRVHRKEVHHALIDLVDPINADIVHQHNGGLLHHGEEIHKVEARILKGVRAINVDQVALALGERREHVVR